MYTVHLWLVGKRVVDFLLVLFELFCQFLRLRCYEQILLKIVLFERGWVTVSENFREKGGRPPTNFGVRKLESLGYNFIADFFRQKWNFTDKNSKIAFCVTLWVT